MKTALSIPISDQITRLEGEIEGCERYNETYAYLRGTDLEDLLYPNDHLLRQHRAELTQLLVELSNSLTLVWDRLMQTWCDNEISWMAELSTLSGDVLETLQELHTTTQNALGAAMDRLEERMV